MGLSINRCRTTKCISVVWFAIVVFSLPLANSQTNTTPPSCPLGFVRVDHPSYYDSRAWKIDIRVRNLSGRKIVGMVFNGAVADATENWTWISNGPLIDLNWNRELNPGQAKNLSWYLGNVAIPANFYPEHASGGAVIPRQILFADGSTWEEPVNREACIGLWYNSHKKFFAKPIALPPVTRR